LDYLAAIRIQVVLSIRPSHAPFYDASNIDLRRALPQVVRQAHDRALNPRELNCKRLLIRQQILDLTINALTAQSCWIKLVKNTSKIRDIVRG
jgi:hypothetical protein